MFNIVGKEVIIKTHLGSYKGKVLFFNGGDKITISTGKRKLQILAPEMVIEVTDKEQA